MLTAIIIVFVLWFIWIIIKIGIQRQNLIDDINSIRISALQDPNDFIENFNFDRFQSNIEKQELKYQISNQILLLLKLRGHDTSRLIKGNIKAYLTLSKAVNEIFRLIKNYQDNFESMQNQDKATNNQQNSIPEIDINDDEILF